MLQHYMRVRPWLSYHAAVYDSLTKQWTEWWIIYPNFLYTARKLPVRAPKCLDRPYVYWIFKLHKFQICWKGLEPFPFRGCGVVVWWNFMLQSLNVVAFVVFEIRHVQNHEFSIYYASYTVCWRLKFRFFPKLCFLISGCFYVLRTGRKVVPDCDGPRLWIVGRRTLAADRRLWSSASDRRLQKG